MFKRDTGVCKEMPYINLREQHKENVMIETTKKILRDLPRGKLIRPSRHAWYSKELVILHTNISVKL